MSVTVIGDAFVDVIVPAQGVKLGETYHRRMITSCGGMANVAVLISRLGERVKVIGKLGDDVFGKYLKQNLMEEGVEDLTFVDHENLTGLCISLVYADGERTMIADRRANDYLTKEEIEKCLDKIIKSSIVFFSGYSFISELTSDAILYAMNACHRKCEIWFNPGAPKIIRSSFKGYIGDFVDVLILNLDEARVITGKYEVQDIAQDLRELVGLGVVTLGKDGCMVLSSEGCTHIPAQNISEVKDTTGAGDAFAAGFMAGRLRGFDLTECAKLGNGAAISFLKERSAALK